MSGEGIKGIPLDHHGECNNKLNTVRVCTLELMCVADLGLTRGGGPINTNIIKMKRGNG